MRFGEYAVICLDVSLFTALADVKPSRFEILKAAAKAYANKILERGGWVAILAFYRRAFPILFFTRDKELVEEAFESLKPVERGVALAEAVKEATYLLLSAPPGYGLRAAVFTSGIFRFGPPPEPIAFFAKSVGVVVDVLTVSGGELAPADVRWVTVFTEQTGGLWEHARSREEAIAKAYLMASREVGAKPWRVWRPGLGVYPLKLSYI